MGSFYTQIGIKLLFLLIFLSSNAVAQNKIYTGLELSFSSGISRYDAPRNSYLATEPGAGSRVNNLFVSDPNHKFHTYGGEISYQFLGPHSGIKTNFLSQFDNMKFFAGYTQGRTEHNQFIGLIDPAGDTLIVPIPTGEVFSLTAPNNEITNANFLYDYKSYSFDIGFKGDLKSPNKKIKISPTAYLNYSQTQTDSKLNGRIDFFFRDFEYNTKVKVQSLSPTIGLNASYAILPRTNLSVGAKYAYNINRGRGRDSLFFTGFGTQEADMTNDRHTHSVGLKTTISYDINSSLSLKLQGQYDFIGNAPRIDTRREGKTSDFTYKSTDIISGNARVTFKF